jgi:hypothetical protein
MLFALSSLVSVTEEQLEALGDDELALVINRFSWFYNNRMNHLHGGGPKDGCYGCGDPDHFIAHYPKKNKHSSSKHDANKRKDKSKYTSGKHKLKGGFNKEAIKEFPRRPRLTSVPSSTASATLIRTPPIATLPLVTTSPSVRSRTS